MAGTEDCASVLEHFIHEVANLPAEINHMMEEIHAKDKDMQRYQSIITSRDGHLQKHIRLNGSLVPHPKEKEYEEIILQNHDLCQDLQNQKIALSDKACVLLDRQIKKLDVKIRELQNDGQLLEGPPIPSIFKRKQQHPNLDKSWHSELPGNTNTPLQVTSGNAGLGHHQSNVNAHRMNNAHQMSSSSVIQPVPTRVSQMSSSSNAHLNPHSSAPATPASALLQNQHQRQRESSVGVIDSNKRRRLNAAVSNMPAQSSSLRQSSLGPGTPKASTPIASSTARAGSAGPRSQAAQQAVAAAKKVGMTKKLVAPHQQISRLKGKSNKRLSISMKKKGVSPSVRSRGDDDESVLSSAESEASQATNSRVRRGRVSKSARSEEPEDVEMEEAGEEEEGEGEEQEDTREYCLCHSVSYGPMVGCENDDCPYEWFHLRCVGLKEEPGKEEIWYCPECRTKPGMGMAGTGGRK